MFIFSKTYPNSLSSVFSNLENLFLFHSFSKGVTEAPDPMGMISTWISSWEYRVPPDSFSNFVIDPSVSITATYSANLPFPSLSVILTIGEEE